MAEKRNVRFHVLWVKLCGNSYTGSFKDLGMTALVSVVKQMMRQGSLVKAVQALKATNGLVEQATEDELANALALADKTGMYTCPHTAVALAVLFKLKEQGVIQSHERVVVSTAHGLKFTNFKLRYHEGTLDEVESLYANPPVNLPADADVVRRVIEERLG